MLLKRFLFLVFLWSGFLFYGCEKNELNWTSESYVPKDLGHYKIYNVSETKYFASASPIVNEFQEMHKISAVKELSFSDVLEIEVSVFRRINEENPWKEVEGYKMNKSLEGLLITNQGTTSMVLKYPVLFGEEWDGNAFNTKGIELYKVQKGNKELLDKAIDIETDKLIKVIKREKSTLIDYISSVQYFAPNIGLVYDEDVALEYCQESNCIGNNKIDSGYEKVMIIKSSGIAP